jgi:hypothetical protein
MAELFLAHVDLVAASFDTFANRNIGILYPSWIYFDDPFLFHARSIDWPISVFGVTFASSELYWKRSFEFKLAFEQTSLEVNDLHPGSSFLDRL